MPAAQLRRRGCLCCALVGAAVMLFHGGMSGLAFLAPSMVSRRDTGKVPTVSASHDHADPVHPQAHRSSSTMGLVGLAMASGLTVAVRQRKPSCSLAAKGTADLEDLLLDGSVKSSNTFSWKDVVLPAFAFAMCCTMAAPAFADDAPVDEGWSFPNPFAFVYDGLVAINTAIIDVAGDLLEDNLGLENSFGWAIIGYSVLVKVVTGPLNEVGTRNSILIQMLTPKINQVKARYGNDTDMASKVTMSLYDQAGINFLAGFLGPFLQLPILYSLFGALQKEAAMNPRASESFLFIPSLNGPAPAGSPNIDWLLPKEGAPGFEPSVGWSDAAAYFIMPILLIVTQYAVTRFQSPQTPEGPTAWLQVAFPVIIGGFALCNPTSLALYWWVGSLYQGVQGKFVRDKLKREFPQYAKVIDGESDVPEITEREPPKTSTSAYEREKRGASADGKGFRSYRPDRNLEEVGAPSPRRGRFEQAKGRRVRRSRSR